MSAHAAEPPTITRVVLDDPDDALRNAMAELLNSIARMAGDGTLDALALGAWEDSSKLARTLGLSELAGTYDRLAALALLVRDDVKEARDG